MRKLILPGFLVIILVVGFLFASNTLAQTSSDCLKQYHQSQAKCSDAARACIDACPGAQGVDLNPLGECLRACDRQENSCDDAAQAAYDVCIKGGRAQAKDETPSSSKSLLDALGINPFEAWLRMQALSRWPEAFLIVPELAATDLIDITYDIGMARVEIDSSSLFGANLRMTVSGETSGVQIRVRGQSEYQDLQPNQNIPDGAYVRINKPTRFDIGDEDIKVQPVGKTGWAEFQVEKSKKNESIDIIDVPGSKVKVRLGRVADRQSQPEITDKIETAAWETPAPAGEKVVDVPGIENTKRYSWDSDSGAVIQSSDWENIEFKEPVVDEGESTTRTVKFGEGEMEVKVRNDNPTVNKFAVDVNGFFDLVVVQTHFFTTYDPKMKQGTVIVYEGEVEVKTQYGKIIRVTPKNGEPGVVVISQKLSPVKVALAGLVLVGVVGGAIMILKRRFVNLPAKRKR